MEIRVDVSHSEDPKDQIAAAYSMFVSRDAQDYSKTYPLPDLSFEGENDEAKCLLRQEYGKKNKKRRMEFAAVRTHSQYFLLIFNRIPHLKSLQALKKVSNYMVFLEKVSVLKYFLPLSFVKFLNKGSKRIYANRQDTKRKIDFNARSR